jgi:diaminopimelate decarboxylase
MVAFTAEIQREHGVEIARLDLGGGHAVTYAEVLGRHCESSDVIAEDVGLPADVAADNLLAVPVSGAYHVSRASNHNQIGRPPMVAVAGGAAMPMLRRETAEDLLRREVG